MTALSERPFPSWTPRFGERLVNIYKPESDPQRVASFVRVRRFDKVSRWVMTDGKGSFWMQDPRAMERYNPDQERTEP